MRVKEAGETFLGIHIQNIHTDGSEERPRICEGVICGKLLLDHKRNQNLDPGGCNICYKHFDKVVWRNILMHGMHI